MHATELPKPFHGDGWVYEEKYDGGRMVAEKAGSRVMLTAGTVSTTRAASLSW
jgi:ATP-dependent DNA ligase